MPKKKRKLHVCRDDWDKDFEKEDTRPIEKRKKPRFSMHWKRLKEILDFD